METCTADKKSICREEVFTTFFNEHVKALRHFLYYRFGDKDEASDVSQEAFTALWKNCATVPYESARAYLYKVAYHRALKSKAHEKVVLTYQQAADHPTTNKESPEYLLEEKQFRDRLMKAIANLNETQRVAFLMNRIDKLTYVEIAASLGIGVKAVEKRIHLAMKALKKELTAFK